MPDHDFPKRIETDRLEFERLAHDRIDTQALTAFVTSEEWTAGLDDMPWFEFETIDDVTGFVDHAEQQWAARDSARYILWTRGPHRKFVGTTAFSPEWEKRRATSDVVLSTQFWGQGYGLERAEAYLDLAFESYQLDIYYTGCVPDNEPSRRMIEKLVARYDGRYEGRLRNEGAVRPDGAVPDQLRYSISRAEYEGAIESKGRSDIEFVW